MSAPPPSQKDGQQVLKYAFDDTTGRIRTDATISPDGIDLEIHHTDDSIAIGTTTDLFTSTTVGPKIGLDVNVINPIPLEVNISAASGDNIAIADQTGTNFVVVNPDGSINVNDGGGSLTVDQGTTPWVVSGNVNASQAGTWNINNVTGTVSLPTGASTLAAQNTGNASLASIDSKLTSPITVTGPLTDSQLRATPVPVSGTVTANQGTSPWVVSGSVTTSPDVNVHDGAGNAISSTSGSLNVDVTNTVPVSQSTSPWIISGSVTANAGTNLNTSALALDTSVVAPQGSISGGTAGTKSELSGGIYNTTPPTLTNGQQASLQFDVNGNLKTTATATVVGTVTANQGTSPWVDNITQFGGSNVVTGTGASGAGIPRVTVSNDSNILATQSGSWSVTANAGTGTFLVDGSAHTQPVSGTITANQGTSPWVVSGTVTTSPNVNVHDGAGNTISSTGTSLNVDVTNTVPVSGPLTDTQLRATPVPISGTVTANAGTGTFLVDGSAHTQPVSGTVAVTQSTSPWVISGTVTTSPNVNVHDGSGVSISSTGSSLNVDVTNTVPVSQSGSWSVTANAGTNLNTSALALDTTVAGLQVNQGSTTSGEKGPLIQGATTTAAPTYTTATTNPLSLTTAGALRTDSSGSTQPVSGTVAVTQSTSPWVTNVNNGAGAAAVNIQDGGNSITVDNAGTFAVQATLAAETTKVIGTVNQGTSPWVTSGTATVSGTVAATQSGNWSTRTQDGAGNNITSTSSALDVNLKSSSITLPVSGTVAVSNFPATQAVTQSTSPWVSNISQFGGSNVVTGTGASGAGIPRVTVSNDSNILATQSGTWNVGLNAGTNTIGSVKLTDGTNTASISAAGAQKVDGSAVTQPVSGTVAVTQSTSPWVVSGTVTANAGTNLNTSALALDTSVNAPQGSVTGGTAGTKSELAGAIYNTTPPTLTNGQQAALQFDVNGNLKTTSTATVAGNVSVTGNVASGAADSGNPVKTGGVYNSTLPTPSSGQRVDTQMDLNGRTLVAAALLDGYKATYSAAFTNLAAPSLATDIFTITGSASKTVRVLQMRAAATQTSGTAYQDIQVIKRSTANSGGGASNIVVVQHAANSGAASSNQITVTVASTGAGNLIVVGASNGNNRTITSVSDGTTTFTQATGAAAQDTTLTSRSDIWYLLSSNSGKTTITVSFSGAAATFNKAAWVWEVSGMNSPTFGTGNAVNTGTQSGGVATGPSFTTAAAQGFAVGLDTTNVTVTANPQAGNSFTAGGDITSGDAGCSLIWSVPGTYNPAWTDSGINFCSSLASFNNTAIPATALTAVSHDSNNAAATATVNVYTGLPTLGATVGLMRSSKLLIGQTTPSNAPTSTAQVPDHYRFGFGPEQAVVLRGTSQVLALNLNGVTTNGLFDLYMEWTEE